MKSTLLALASLLATTLAAPADTNLLEFNPPEVTIENAMAYTTFGVRLREAPGANGATINLKVDGISLSACSLSFNDLNFGEFQQVQILPNPAFVTAEGDKTVNIEASVCAYGSPYNESKQTIGCRHTFKKGGKCKITGDPHYSPFSGNNFDYQGEGTFYIVKGDMLNVQNVQGKCHQRDDGGWMTCTEGLAIRFGTSAILFHLNTNNGQMTMSRLTDQVRETELKLSKTETVSSSFDVELGDGSTITISSGEWKNRFHMDVNVHLAHGDYGNVGGLCNRVGSDALHCGDNTTTQDPNTFGESWRVGNGDDMFQGQIVIPPGINPPDSYLNQNQCTAVPVCPTPVYVPSTTQVVPTSTTQVVPTSTEVVPTTSVAYPTTEVVPTSTEVVPTTTEVVPTTPVTPVYPTTTTTETPVYPTVDCHQLPLYTPTETTLPAVETSVVPQNETVVPIAYGDALDQCQTIIRQDDCASIVDRSFYVEACAKDVSLTGSFDMAESTRKSYLRDCRVTTKYMKKSPDNHVREQAEVIRDKCGLGVDTECPLNCSGRGQCTANGCACDKGYGGQGCSVDLNKLAYTFQPSLSAGNVTTGTTTLNDSEEEEEQETQADTTHSTTTGNTGNTGSTTGTTAAKEEPSAQKASTPKSSGFKVNALSTLGLVMSSFLILF